MSVIAAYDDKRVAHFVEEGTFFPPQTVLRKTRKSFYLSRETLIPFERHYRSLVVAGDPVCRGHKNPVPAFEEFVELAHQKNLSVCGYYFSAQAAQILPGNFYQAGVSRVLNLKTFQLQGHFSRDIRRALNQGRKSRLQFFEIPQDEKDLFEHEIQRLDKKWIRTRKGSRIRFLLSRPAVKEWEVDRWFLVRDEKNQANAFVSLHSYWTAKNQRGFYVDHMIQSPRGHRFALDFLISRLILNLQQEGGVELSLGFCPFQRIQDQTWLESFMKWNGRLDWFYNSRGLYNFKRKFTDQERTRYLLLDPNHSFSSQLLALSRATW